MPQEQRNFPKSVHKKKISVSQRPRRREREEGEAVGMWIGEKGRHRQKGKERDRETETVTFRNVTSRRKEGTYRRSKNKNGLSTCQSAPAS